MDRTNTRYLDTDNIQLIQRRLATSISTIEMLLARDDIIECIGVAVESCVKAFKQGNKVLFCGNGGSAADAQHLAAEFSGRFYIDRGPLDAEALHVNTSFLTAVANDYSYEEVFSRLVEAKGKRGDVLFGLSTSGNSMNVVRALKQAQTLGLTTIAFTGQTGGRMRRYSDILICIPSKDTPRVQECHILVGHIICELVERGMFPLR